MSALEKHLRLVREDPPIFEVDVLGATDDELLRISQATSIGLDAAEMKSVQEHFRRLGRNPRDIELEALGQAWSEHCCYKSSKPVLKKHVYGIHEERLIAREDAGVMPFDDEHAYVVKIESHNHPSAIEPYGGAATGIGGVLRDVVCMGAQPIALVDPLFFGNLDTPTRDVPAGTKHPRYLLGGVVSGIRDYGNRVGIPTVAGMVHFHPKFLTNCLVNVGAVGIMRREHLIHSRAGGVGDKYILLGGRTGRDGIHGVTFASEELSEEAEEESRSAVQLGDPITKEPLMHVCLEANEKGLLTGMKDLGGGGLSCVCGEMALDAGLGAVVDLDAVPLKERGMKPWEVWVSESQERMMFTVRPDDVQKVLDICRKWDVEAVVLGEVVPEKKVVVRWGGETVFEMESEFLYGGPVYERPAEIRQIPADVTRPVARDDYSKAVLEILGHQNVCSREVIIRQYDHEVRANTALKPLQGKLGFASHGDATVLKPVADSWKGLALTTDVNPHLTDIDPYWGAVSAVEEVVRNLAAVGARLDGVADNLNFPNPRKPRSMGDIGECARGLGDSLRTLGVPFTSGNVSMYNESSVVAIPPTPTLLGTGIVEDVRKCVTTDLKHDGSRLYLVGAPTKDEMGGSVWYDVAGGKSTVVPRVDWAASRKAAEAVVGAIESGLAWAVHDVAAGGLATAVAEMAFGGDMGAIVHLDRTGDVPTDVRLFGESNTRWIIEARVPTQLEQHFADAGVFCAPLGIVGSAELRFMENGKDVARVPLAAARAEWRDALPAFIGGVPEPAAHFPGGKVGAGAGATTRKGAAKKATRASAKKAAKKPAKKSARKVPAKKGAAKKAAKKTGPKKSAKKAAKKATKKGKATRKKGGR